MLKKHLIKCWLWKILWGVSVLALLLAWVSVLRGNPVWGLDPLLLLWGSLVLGVLSIPIKLDCHACNVCGVRSPDAL